MARPPRIYFEGAYYHVFSRGNGGKRIFFDPIDYRNFLSLFAELRITKQLTCLAYCLMPNHFHFLIQVAKHSVSTMMQQALGSYGRLSNIRRETFGHVFQGRYGDRLCLTENYVLELIRYIHTNPIPSLVTKPEDWPWSGHRALALGVSDPLIDVAGALSHFGDDLEVARREYLSFLSQETDWTPEKIEVAEVRRKEPSEPSTDLPTLAASIIAPKDVTLGQICGAGQERKVTAARHDFILEAWRAGVSRVDLARFLGCSDSAISQVIRRKGRTVSSVTLSGSDPTL